jgi:hypothetical protein
MPADANRLQRPVGRRDRRLLIALACVLAVAVAAAIVLPRGGAPAQAQPGCIVANVAGVLGGGTVTGCGRRAAVVCRMYAAAYASVAAQCAALPRERPAHP